MERGVSAQRDQSQDERQALALGIKFKGVSKETFPSVLETNNNFMQYAFLNRMNVKPPTANKI